MMMNNNNLDAPIPPISIFLRSSDYTYTTDDNKNNLFFELNKPIKCYSNMNMNIKLNSFKFTNSFYTINDNNNNFYYRYFTDGTIYKVTLTNGFYNVTTLLEHLNTLLENIFIFSYNESTLRIKLTNVNLSVFIQLYAGPLNCLEVLGFDSEVNTTYESAIHIAPYLMNMMSVELLHINIPNLSLDSISLKNSKKYNILDSIHVTSAPGESQTYNNINNFHYKLSEDLITFININILDQNYNSVDFNNIDWYINLCITFSYIPQLIIPPDLKQSNDESMKEILIDEEKRILDNYYKNSKK